MALKSSDGLRRSFGRRIVAVALKLSDGTEVPVAEPFFITGSGRCGTTLLRRLLLEHAPTAIPPENYALSQTADFWRRAEEEWAPFCRAIVEYQQWKSEDWPTFRMDADELEHEFLALEGEHQNFQSLWHVFHALWGRRNNVSYEVWGDKTPINAFSLPAIRAMFPDARYIFMVRDGYDTALSAAEALGRDLTAAAQRWVDANDAILAFIDDAAPHRSLVVRYEELVERPDETVDACLAFLGLARCPPRDVAPIMVDAEVWPHLRNALEPVSTKSIGRAHDQSVAQRSAAIAEIIEPMQARLGYASLITDALK